MRTFRTLALALLTFSCSQTLLAGPATHFSVTTQTSVTSGTSISVSVKALDASNKVDTSYAGTVHMTSTDANALLPVDFALAFGAAFTQVTLISNGSQTVTATDAANPALTGTSASISVSVNNNPATVLVVSAPTTATVGVAFGVSVKALDQFSHIATSYGGTIHFTSTDPAAALPADTMLANGLGSFPTTLMTAGTQSVSAHDIAAPALSGTTFPINTGAGPATHLSVSTPSNVSVYTPFLVSVSARDVGGNIATSYAGQVHLTSTDASAQLPPDQALGSGSASFSVTFPNTGVYTIAASDVATGTLQGMSPLIESDQLVDGSYDPRFGVGGRKLVAPFSSAGLALRPDGRILLLSICNNPTPPTYYFTFCVVQLTADGKSYDLTFGPSQLGYVNLSMLPGFIANSAVCPLGIHVLADGRFVVVGYLCGAGFVPDPTHAVIAVLKADGSDFDRSLANGAGWLLDDANFFQISSAAFQADDSILLGGTVHGIANLDMAVGRWPADLSGRDPAFAASSSVSGVRYVAFDLDGIGGDDSDVGLAVASTPDGKVLLGGSAHSPSGKVAAVARLTPDGSLDQGFGAGGRVHADSVAVNVSFSLAADSYQRVVFSADTSLVRLQPTGTLDPTFSGDGDSLLSNISGGPTPSAVTLQPDGKILVRLRGSTGVLVARFGRSGALDLGFGPSGTVERTFDDGSLGCCDVSSTPTGLIFAGRRGLLISGEWYSGTANSGGVMQLATDVIYGDGFGD